MNELPRKPDANGATAREVAARDSDLLARLAARTPARLAVGRRGPAYCTKTQLELREDHALATDAVRAEFDLARDFDPAWVAQFSLFEVGTLATSKTEFLKSPDRGRRLSEQAKSDVQRLCPAGTDLQIVLGDGLSSAAVAAQVPNLLPLLLAGAQQRGWTVGRPFFVRHCRVGVLNDIGDLLDPAVVVLLIGERPGLATAESLSAYMAFRPRAGHTDAVRNLISNIHTRGVDPAAAAPRILALAELMRQAGTSGVAIKEQLPTGGAARLP